MLGLINGADVTTVDFKEQTLSMECETTCIFPSESEKDPLDKYNEQYNTALVYALIYKSQMIYKYQYVLIIAKIPVQEGKSCTWMITTGVTNKLHWLKSILYLS